MGRFFNSIKIMARNCIVDAGVTNGWTWKKYADGRYEAEKLVDVGSVYTSTTPMYTVDGNVKMYLTPAIPSTSETPPHTLVSGDVVYDVVGNNTAYAFKSISSGYKVQLGRVSSSGGNFEFEHVKVLCKVVGGKWK